MQTNQDRRELPSLSQAELRQLVRGEQALQCHQSWLTGGQCPELLSALTLAGVEALNSQNEAMTQAAATIASPDATLAMVAAAQTKVLALLTSLDD